MVTGVTEEMASQIVNCIVKGLSSNAVASVTNIDHSVMDMGETLLVNIYVTSRDKETVATILNVSKKALLANIAPLKTPILWSIGVRLDGVTLAVALSEPAHDPNPRT